MTDDTQARRLAAPAPTQDDEADAPQTDEQRDLDALCERWVRWKSTRRLFGPPPTMGSVLGQLSGTRTRPLRQGGPDAVCNAELAALHLAYLCQPDALDKRVFDLYYVHRVAPVKAAAAALEISRKHFYTVLGDFRHRLHSAAQSILAEEEGRLQHMQHARAARTLSDE
jgi:hypothetical protein